MKRMALVLGIVASLGISQVANATPFVQNFADTALNWDTWNATTNNLIDPQGTPDISSTTVTTDNGNLQNVTFNLNSKNFNVTSGDLFINLGGDLTWDYVVRSLGTTLNTGTGTVNLGLYALNGLDYNSATAQNVYAKSFYGSDPWAYRAGLPIGLLNTPDASSFLGYVAYSAGATAISFDFTNSSLQLLNNSIIGYEVSCANDVIYQQVPVPEPGTMALLGFGLLSLAVYGKRRINKEV